VFSALPVTAWATPEVIPSPYIEDVRDDGQIPADKFLTVIATSNDLYITSIALKAINADSGKENIPATSGSIQISQSSNGCYEYKQDFVLNGDLKITGGKWSFEVKSTYRPIKGGSEVKSNIRMLPNDYEKAHWYSYYTIVNGTPEMISPPSSDDPPVSPADNLPVSPPDNPPVSPPDNPLISPPDNPPVSPPDNPLISPPNNPPVSPPNDPPVSPPDNPLISPPDNPPVSPPDDPPVSPPDNPPVSPPDNQPVLPEYYTTGCTDVSESAWYYDAVRFAIENGLMNGIGNNLFAPGANLSRAQLTQILYNKEGKPTVDGMGSFTDVKGAWYSDAVIWATERNIVSGYGNGLFGPNDNITREQLAVMLWRYAGKPIASTNLTFSDTDQISDFAQSAIRWAVENKILNGKGSNILAPKSFATRAEVAQMLKNYLG